VRNACVQDYARKLVVSKNPNILQEEENELEKMEKEERSSYPSHPSNNSNSQTPIPLSMHKSDDESIETDGNCYYYYYNFDDECIGMPAKIIFDNDLNMMKSMVYT
jgi:hypothetical protein